MKGLWILIALAVTAVAAADPSRSPDSIRIDAGALQEAVANAPPHAVLVADRSRQVEITETVRIEKPVTLVGLNMRLKPGLAKTPIIEVLSEEVRIREFTLEGNGDSVKQPDRAPLILIRRGRFVVEDGETNNSAKDGVMITPVPEYGDIEHGVLRNLTARDTIRDVVSIGGRGHEGLFVRHLVVENIRSYGSQLRGPVEVSDGSEHITVRDVYAESSFYGVDVQDHRREGMVNRQILIDGVQVKDCVTAVRTANRDFGHNGLTIRNVTGVDFRADERWRPLHVRNTSNVVIENVRIEGGPPEGPWVLVQNSDNLTLRNVAIVDAGQDGAVVVVEDSNNALLDNIVITGEQQPTRGLEYRVTADETFGGLRIRNVVASAVRDVGIALEDRSKSGVLESYFVTANMATVKADLPADRRVVEGNL
ncbi:MAG: right-handed parallel beta-helix repeat-containing protein [Bryobacterales bacterium]|nr:right-handed parallel beta-helix repeat-containing protein [Bryobacterales bacterium]